jgi:hypothetical protein
VLDTLITFAWFRLITLEFLIYITCILLVDMAFCHKTEFERKKRYVSDMDRNNQRKKSKQEKSNRDGIGKGWDKKPKKDVATQEKRKIHYYERRYKDSQADGKDGEDDSEEEPEMEICETRYDVDDGMDGEEDYGYISSGRSPKVGDETEDVEDTEEGDDIYSPESIDGDNDDNNTEVGQSIAASNSRATTVIATPRTPNDLLSRHPIAASSSNATTVVAASRTATDSLPRQPITASSSKATVAVAPRTTTDSLSRQPVAASRSKAATIIAAPRTATDSLSRQIRLPAPRPNPEILVHCIRHAKVNSSKPYNQNCANPDLPGSPGTRFLRQDH